MLKNCYKNKQSEDVASKINKEVYKVIRDLKQVTEVPKINLSNSAAKHGTEKLTKNERMRAEMEKMKEQRTIEKQKRKEDREKQEENDKRLHTEKEDKHRKEQGEKEKKDATQTKDDGSKLQNEIQKMIEIDARKLRDKQEKENKKKEEEDIERQKEEERKKTEMEMQKRQQQEVVNSTNKDNNTTEALMIKREDGEGVVKIEGKEKREVEEIGLKHEWILEEVQGGSTELREKEKDLANDKDMRTKQFYASELDKRRLKDEGLKKIQEIRVIIHLHQLRAHIFE